MLYDYLTKKFRVDALSAIYGPGHKLRNYALMKTGVGLENYLNVIKMYPSELSVYLEIDKGRRRGIVEVQTLCPFCKNRWRMPFRGAPYIKN